MRIAALFAVLASACGVPGETCGRGRCTDGATCISIFGQGRQNQGWRTQGYPNVEGEWWCERSCPAGRGCAGDCLQDPADEDTIVCAVDQVTLVYQSAGTSCLCPDGGGICPGGLTVQSIDLTDGCTPAASVLTSCPAGVDCSTGALRAGDVVPGVRLHGVDSIPAYGFSYCPGRPESTLGPALPEGVTVRVWVDMETCR